MKHLLFEEKRANDNYLGFHQIVADIKAYYLAIGFTLKEDKDEHRCPL